MQNLLEGFGSVVLFLFSAQQDWNESCIEDSCANTKSGNYKQNEKKVSNGQENEQKVAHWSGDVLEGHNQNEDGEDDRASNEECFHSVRFTLGVVYHLVRYLAKSFSIFTLFSSLRRRYDPSLYSVSTFERSTSG